MNKPLFLFVGKSASGKTTIANLLESCGYTQVYSYTTRQQRFENEPGHVFITEHEYDQLENIVASTIYNGNRYCTTLEQIQDADIYVVDPPGVQTLLNNYDKVNRDIHIVYFAARTHTRIKRMIERGDSDTQIVGRLLNDEENDWLGKIYDYVEDACKSNKQVYVCVIDADLSLQQVYTDIKDFIAEGSY